MLSRRIAKQSPKPKSTRGRIALPGVGLRDLFTALGVPVGLLGDELVADLRRLDQQTGLKSSKAGAGAASAPLGRREAAHSGSTLSGERGWKSSNAVSAVEVKRMYVVPEQRGHGHARRMLAALEDAARAAGHDVVVLETGLRQPEAIALYESAGYEPVPGFGYYKDAPLSRCFARRVAG